MEDSLELDKVKEPDIHDICTGDVGGQNEEVIGLLLSHHDHAVEGEAGQLQIHPAHDEEVHIGGGEGGGGGEIEEATDSILERKISLTVDDGSGLQAVQLSDGSTAIVQQKDGGLLEGQAVQLEDGTTAFIQSLGDKDGQAVQLEDGTMAYILRTNAQVDGESVKAVQLEDGTTALIQTHVTEFDQTQGFGSEDTIDSHSLNVLDQFTAQNSSDQTTLQLTTGEHDFTTPMRVTVGPESQRTHKIEVLGNSKTFICSHDGCGRIYTASHHLKVHERTHSGHKPYKCEHPGCEKAFATGYGLKSHIRVHTGEKPYCCAMEGCSKAFKTSGDLQKHTRTHTGERPFKCPFEGCEKAFTTSNIRKVHIRTHTGERPYICPNDGCGRAFASATNYKNHMRIHTGEKPYVCTVAGCGKRFTEYSSLYKHHVVHTHSKPYMCSSCGKNYRQISTLAMHKRQAHGEDALVDSLEIAITQGDKTDIVGTLLAGPPNKDAKAFQIATVSLDEAASAANAAESAQLFREGLSPASLTEPKTILVRDATGQTRQVTMVSAVSRDAALAAVKAAVGSSAMLEVVSPENALGLSDMQLQQVMVAQGEMEEGEEEEEEGEKMEDSTASSHLTEAHMASLDS